MAVILMFSRFIHDVIYGKFYFFLMLNSILLYIFFIHSFNNIYLDCFHILAIENNGAMKRECKYILKILI